MYSGTQIVMKRWRLSRLLVLIVTVLAACVYFVPLSYWSIEPSTVVHDDHTQLKAFPFHDQPHQFEDWRTAMVDPVAENFIDGKNAIATETEPDSPDVSSSGIQPLEQTPTTAAVSDQPLEYAHKTSDREPAEIAAMVATQLSLGSSTELWEPSTRSQRSDPIQFRDASFATLTSDYDFSDHSFRQEYEKLSCKFPLLDPWDELITPFLSHPQPLVCLRVQQDITYVDPDGFLRFNETEYHKAISMYGNLSCYYRYIDKLDDNDHSISYVDGGKYFGPPTVVRMTSPTVEVKCEKLAKNTDRFSNEVYWDIHAYPILHSDKTLRTDKTETPSLSVLILGVDSVSLSAFRRHLPLTYAYTRDVMKFHIFRGHHKIGDNSFPNQLAVLLGKRVVNESWPNMMDEVREDYARIRFDHWPLLWRSFAERGYETSFNEDTPHWGLFHYFAQGFVRKPVHHYYHQYWLALSKGDRRYHKYCFGNTAKLERQLDLVRKRMIIGRHRKWFDYVFATELFHQDEGYEAEKADPYFLKFFRDMYEGGHFNQTVIIFMSDHGHRYASLRQTLVGLLEERLPMFNIWFPEWFYKGNAFNETLHNNTVRLTTHFDVHETLLDILDNNYRSGQRIFGARGLSLLYPISHNRTCDQAGVPDHYCTCLSEVPVSTNDSSAMKAAEAAVAHLNLVIANTSLCSFLTMSKILRVEKLGMSEKIARGVSDLKSALQFESETGAPSVRPLNKLRITFLAQPGNALFEVITTWNGWKSSWVVDGQMHRLNAYATTAYCIQDRILSRYCICSN